MVWSPSIHRQQQQQQHLKECPTYIYLEIYSNHDWTSTQSENLLGISTQHYIVTVQKSGQRAGLVTIYRDADDHSQPVAAKRLVKQIPQFTIICWLALDFVRAPTTQGRYKSNNNNNNNNLMIIMITRPPPPSTSQSLFGITCYILLLWTWN